MTIAMPKATPFSTASPAPASILQQPDALAKQKRLSLQQVTERSSSSAQRSPTRRNTIQMDNRNSPKVRKKLNKTVNVMQPVIDENEVVDVVIVKAPTKNNEVPSFTIEDNKKSSKSIRQNGKVAYEDNFSNKLSRSSSVNNSIKSESKQGSVQSLEVVREQYCCLQRKTKLERILSVVVFVLSIIVMALVVVIIVLAKNKGMQSFKDFIH